ncbi:MAG: DUF1640 domain-containing protein [Gammaproteobacteria bacterium]
MAITTFDTHKFVRRLEKAGVPLEQAEVQAEVLTEAFNVNLESLVTKEYLESRLDAKFAEQDSRFDGRVARFRSDLSADISNLKIEMGREFAQASAKIDANFKVFLWTQAIVVTGVVIPLMQSLVR